MLKLFGVVVYHSSMVKCRGPWYMCILLYVKHICGVVVFYTSVVNWRGLHLPQVYVHSALCGTYVV